MTLPEIPPVFQPYVDSLLKAAGNAVWPKIVQGVQKKVKEIDYFDKAKRSYLAYIRNEIGTVQIFGMQHPLPLEEIYIETRFFSKEETYIRQQEAVAGENLIFGRRHSGRFIYGTLSAQDIINASKQKPIMVLGDPGAGKSTMLRAVALSSIRDNEILANVNYEDKLPIYIELRKYAETDFENVSIKDYFVSQYNEDGFGEAIEWLLEQGKAVILLDAFDEVPAENQDRISEKIKSFRIKYEDCPIIVSSRIGNAAVIQGFSIYEVAEFSDSERKSYIDRWFALHQNEEKAGKLLKELENQKGIAEITTNPLLLSLVCVLYQRDLEIPSKKTTIYKRCVEILLREWDTSRAFRRNSVFSELDDDTKMRIISEIAQKYMEAHERYFQVDSILPVVADILDKYEIEPQLAENFLTEVFSHHGLIVRVGHDMYGFSHLTFQEYLAARFYVSNNLTKELIDKLAEDYTWKETVMMAAGETANIKPIILEIANHENIDLQDKLEYVSTMLRFAKAVISPPDRREIFVKIAELVCGALQEFEFVELDEESSSTVAKIMQTKMRDDFAVHLDDSITIYATAGSFALDRSTPTVRDCRSRKWFGGEVPENYLTDLSDEAKFLASTLLGSRRYALFELGEPEGTYYISIKEIDSPDDIFVFMAGPPIEDDNEYEEIEDEFVYEDIPSEYYQQNDDDLPF